MSLQTRQLNFADPYQPKQLLKSLMQLDRMGGPPPPNLFSPTMLKMVEEKEKHTAEVDCGRLSPDLYTDDPAAAHGGGCTSGFLWLTRGIQRCMLQLL